MEKFSQEFSENLCKFLADLYKFTKNNSVKKIIDVFKNLHPLKTAKKFIEATGKHSQCIESKDETLFRSKFIILPGIDMHKMWPLLDSSQKNKIWLHLEILSISANMVVQEGSESTVMTDSKSMSSMSVHNRELGKDAAESSMNNFNPYVGVGTDDDNFGTEELFGGPDELPGDNNSSGFSLSSLNLTNMIDIGKFVNIKELQEQINKIKDSDIDEAFEQLKRDTNGSYDQDTANSIASLLKDITHELKNINTDKTLQISDLITIVEGLISKITPKLKDGKFDMKNLWKIAQSLSEKYTPAEGDNNMKLLTSFMQQQFTMLDKVSEGNAIEITKEQQEAYMNQCNDILKDLGIGNVDIAKVDPLSIMQNLTSCVNSNGKLDVGGIQKMLSGLGGIGGFDLSNIQNMMGNLLTGPQNTHSQKKKKHNRKR